jgi:M6 family metalloprotease-like protein
LLLITFFIFIATSPGITFGTYPSETELSEPEANTTFCVSRYGLDGPAPNQQTYTPRDAFGVHHLLVILVEFTDKLHTFTQTQVETSSITNLNNYIDEVSFGLTSVTGEATAWLQLGHAREYYVEGTAFPSDPKFNLITDAVDAADPFVDYNDYDGITIIHAGQGQELSHDWRDYWSSEWWGFSLHTDDGVTLHRASVSPEQSNPGQPAFVGVLAHEFGHDLGLPDLYDTSYQEEFVGDWGLMGSGSWNGPIGVGDSPAHMMGYSKAYLGYVNGSQLVEAPLELNTLVDPLETATTGVHLIKIPVTSLRYYLVEVRQKIGYDTYLPDKGVLISYVDETLSSGSGIVKVIDAHPGTPSKSDAAFDIGTGEAHYYMNADDEFTIVLEEAVGNSYNITVLRAYMSFANLENGAAILEPNYNLQWTGAAAAPGINHYELSIDGGLVYTGMGTNYSWTGMAAGAHTASLTMVLNGTGRRLTIESNFVVDLALPTITEVLHHPSYPAFGDSIQVRLKATDDTWIVNATVYYRRATESIWYAVNMTFYSGDEWRVTLGVFLWGVNILYYVTVTDAGGRSVTNDNGGENYSFTVEGIGLVIIAIIGGVIFLAIVVALCTSIQKRRRRQPTVKAAPPPSLGPVKGPSFSETESSTFPKEVDPTTFCHVCGFPLTPGAQYCGKCGRPASG